MPNILVLGLTIETVNFNTFSKEFDLTQRDNLTKHFYCIMYSVLGCNAMYNRKQLPVFQRNILPKEVFDVLKKPAAWKGL
jgi:hypothetical protein